MPSVNGGQGGKNKQVVKERQKDGGGKETSPISSLYVMSVAMEADLGRQPSHRQGERRRSYRGVPERPPLGTS